MENPRTGHPIRISLLEMVAALASPAFREAWRVSTSPMFAHFFDDIVNDIFTHETADCAVGWQLVDESEIAPFERLRDAIEGVLIPPRGNESGEWGMPEIAGDERYAAVMAAAGEMMQVMKAADDRFGVFYEGKPLPDWALHPKPESWLEMAREIERAAVREPEPFLEAGEEGAFFEVKEVGLLRRCGESKALAV